MKTKRNWESLKELIHISVNGKRGSK